jgi:VanZ family protein
MSSLSVSLPSSSIPHFDKIIHFFEYTVFGILIARAFKNSSRAVLAEKFKLFAFLTLVLFGVSDEYHQLFVAGRQFSVFDIIADAAGGITGVFIYGRCRFI